MPEDILFIGQIYVYVSDYTRVLLSMRCVLLSDISVTIYFFFLTKHNIRCGNAKALEKLMVILEKGHCIEDKIDAYYLYATILHAW